jgi:hypothetical protein
MSAAELPAAGGFDVSVVTSLAGFDQVADEWLSFLDDALPPDEMQHHPSVVRASLTSDDVKPRFVIVRLGGTVVAIAPFFLQDTEIRLRLSVIEVGTLPARALRLLGDDLLLRRGVAPGEVLEAVFDQVDHMRSAFDVIWIYSQRTTAPLWTFLTSPRQRSRWRPIVVSPRAETIHGIAFDRPIDEYRALVRSRTGFPGKAIRRFWRDAAPDTKLIRVTEPDQVDEFLRDVDQVYNASWQARTYGRRSRCDASEAARYKALASFGFLRSYVLHHRGVASAFVIGHQYRGKYSYTETGYDSQHASGSPGSVLTYAIIEDLFTCTPPRELDFGYGDGAYKRIFGNITAEVCSVYVVHSGRWRWLLGVQQALNVIYGGVRNAIARAGLDRVVRRRLKRQ